MNPALVLAFAGTRVVGNLTGAYWHRRRVLAAVVGLYYHACRRHAAGGSVMRVGKQVGAPALARPPVRGG